MRSALFRYRNMAAEVLKKRAAEAIDSLSSELWQLNNKIWKNPELGFKENFAHEQLTNFLDNQGFAVTRHSPLDTSFVAKVNCDDRLPTVGVICEYDALPEIGHACGHNLIAEAGVAAAVGIKVALGFTNEKLGNLVVLGTPAEEGGGGKLSMIDSGCFKDLDICMMVHPFPVDDVYPVFLARVKVTVRYKGHAAHAAAFPWEGVNALDAAVLAYNNVSALRQQMKPTWRVHGIISNGGVKPNIIPETSEMVFSVRAPTNSELEVLKSKVQKCFEAASIATGCTVDITWAAVAYDGLMTNSKLAELYKVNAQNLGIIFKPTQEQKNPKGSTDMGNVSNVVPSIHPVYSIGSTAVNHTRAFTAAAGTEEGHKKTLAAAKAMAMSAIDVLCSPKLLGEIKEEFNKATK